MSNIKNIFENLPQYLKCFIPQMREREDGKVLPWYPEWVKAIYMAILLIFTGFNIYAISPLSLRFALNWSGSLLYLLKFDTVSMEVISFVQLQTIVAYILSFVLGGCFVFILVRLTTKIGVSLGVLANSKTVTALLGCFILAFFAGTLMAVIGGYSYFSYSMFRWLCPLFAFVGGFIMHIFSFFKLHVE